MKKRAVYSIYIDVPEKEHYANASDMLLNKNDIKVKKTRDNFIAHYQKLLDNKKAYCDSIGVPFFFYENDNEYKDYLKMFLSTYPEITGYEVVNFYKIKKLYDLSKEYDEILYLDFDAIPTTSLNFFDVWDLTKGICVYKNDDQIRNHKPLHLLRQTTRSPTAKYYNAQAMLIESNRSPDNNVINTGIIGASKYHLEKLDYFKNFKETLSLMTKLRYDKNSMYPKNIRDIFRYDNETIFSYKVKLNNVNIQWLDNEWHYFFNNQYYIPKETKIVHTINKDFDQVWSFCEKHNL